MTIRQSVSRKRSDTGKSPTVFAIVAAVISVAAAAFADDNEWVYDTSGRKEIVPSAAAVTVFGLDAKARGFGGTNPTEVDKWYWSWCFSNECPLYFGAPGIFMLIR